jgi:hypothetical protein
MASSFPFIFNNFEMTLAADFAGGASIGVIRDTMTISSADLARLHTVWAACDYTDPNSPTVCALKYTAIAPDALDSSGRLVDVSKTAIFIGFTDFTTTLLDVRPAYDNMNISGYGFEGALPLPFPSFPAGSILRCEMTAGLVMAAYKAINLIETVTGTSLNT